MQHKLGSANRTVAAILGLVWACLGVAGVVAAYLSGRWVMGLAGLFACGYAVLWIRVVARARMLTWNEMGTPWRRR